jgi:calcineurin-like phosphoesterase family protein
MERIWLTGDYHFGHGNIIRYCKRPFRDYKEMDRTIIRNHNTLINDDDLVFYVGDFCFNHRSNEYARQLNGKIIYIGGNHDSESLIRGLMLNYTGLDIWVTHNPRDHDPDVPLNLVAHVHDKWKIQKIGNTTLVNVGIDVWGYKPVLLDEIIATIQISKERTMKESNEPSS